MTWIVIAAIVAVLVFAIVVYNNLVKLRQMVREGWSGIDVQLKRRADLIPNLVETVKGYAAHERVTLDMVVQRRNESLAAAGKAPVERATTESLFGDAIGRMMALSESYPDLKASENFSKLQDALADTEKQLQFARRYYNGAVRMLNTKVEQFPGMLLARPLGFQQADYFELGDDADALLPNVILDRTQ